MGQKLLVQESTGNSPANNSNNRLEAGGQEGNGGQELHHFLHQYNQQSHSPGQQQGLQGGLSSMPLSPQSLRHDSNSGIVGVKREPEDLSSSRGGQSNKRHKQSPESPTPPAMYHHQLQVDKKFFFFAFFWNKNNLKQNCFSGSATVRQSLRPLHAVQSANPIDGLQHIRQQRERQQSLVAASRVKRRLRDERRTAVAGLVECHLAAGDQYRLLHEVRGRAELLRRDARDTSALEQQQSAHRRFAESRLGNRHRCRHTQTRSSSTDCTPSGNHKQLLYYVR